MKIIKNELSNIPKINISIDNTGDLPYIPKAPLPKKSFCMYVCGSPGSGKTNLLLSLLMSHPTKKSPNKPKYYYKYFEKIELISCSLQTLPNKFLKGINQEQTYNYYDDFLLENIIEKYKDDEKNYNILLILDDCIKSLKRSKNLCKAILNRRHATHSADNKKQGGLSLLITSQKFNLLALEVRCNMSHIIVFKTSNNAELNAIKDELMSDLNPKQQKDLLKFVWDEPFNFLLIIANNPIETRYYKNFSKIVFDENEFE